MIYILECKTFLKVTLSSPLFPSATRFLHENGVLLHYNDQLRGLNHLYFIDPSWVCDLIATLVTIRERNPFIVEGLMKMKDLELVLRDPKFPLEFIPQVKCHDDHERRRTQSAFHLLELSSQSKSNASFSRDGAAKP